VEFWPNVIFGVGGGALVLNRVVFPFFKSSCGYPSLGSTRKVYSPWAGSLLLFQDDRNMSSRVTKLNPYFIPGSNVSQG
jgi:hypothetical protein